MTIKRHFFGKDCIIDRQLLDRDHIHHQMKEKGFEFTHLLFLNQIHSSDVLVLDNIGKLYDYQNLPKVDALVTNLKNIAIAVFTADCAPVMFFDEEKNVIAIAHAGWKGAKLGVLQNTIEAMKNLGAKNIHAQIGPMIQQDSYEISQEFYDAFLEENVDNKRFFKNSDKSAYSSINHPPLEGGLVNEVNRGGVNFKKPRPLLESLRSLILPQGKDDLSESKDKSGHYLFDLPAYVISKLEGQGLASIENLAVDTYINEEEYFSYRRSCHAKEEDCGRNVSVIAVF